MSSISMVDSNSSYMINNSINNSVYNNTNNSAVSSKTESSVDKINDSLMKLNIEKLARNIEKENNKNATVKKSGEARADEIERLERSLEQQLQRKRMVEMTRESLNLAEKSRLNSEARADKAESNKKAEEKTAEENYARTNNKDVDEVREESNVKSEDTVGKTDTNVGEKNDDKVNAAEKMDLDRENKAEEVKKEDSKEETVKEIKNDKKNNTAENSDKTESLSDKLGAKDDKDEKSHSASFSVEDYRERAAENKNDSVWENVDNDAKDIRDFLSANRDFSSAVLSDAI